MLPAITATFAFISRYEVEIIFRYLDDDFYSTNVLESISRSAPNGFVSAECVRKQLCEKAVAVKLCQMYWSFASYKQNTV